MSLMVISLTPKMTANKQFVMRMSIVDKPTNVLLCRCIILTMCSLAFMWNVPTF